MQQGGKNRWLPICRERPHPWVELLWARGRQAGLLLAWGGERGGSGPPIQEHATLLLLHCLGRGQHQRQQDWPCNSCSLLLLLPRTSSSILPPRTPLPFQGKTRQFLYWEVRRTGTEPEPNPGAQPAISLVERWLCVSISWPT